VAKAPLMATVDPKSLVAPDFDSGVRLGVRLGGGDWEKSVREKM